MDVKSHSDKISDRNEDDIIGNWKEGNPCYTVANSVLVFCGR